MKADKISKEISKLINRHYGMLVISFYGYTFHISLTMPRFVPNWVNVWIRKAFKVPKPKIEYGNK